MIKVVAVSDTHKNLIPLNKIDRVIKESNYLIHAGDGVSDVYRYKAFLGENLITVSGNCDFSTQQDEVQKTIGGKRFFITHGHKFSVKSDLEKLKYRAYELNADIVIFGHTHAPIIEKENNIYFINPGSLRAYGSPSYCYIILQGEKIFPKIVEVM